MNIFVNGYSSKAHEINAGILQGILLSPTFLLLYINYLPKNIFRSPVNIYANDTMVYGYTSKNLVDQIQTVDFFTDNSHGSMAEKVACIIQYLQIKASSIFHPH